MQLKLEKLYIVSKTRLAADCGSDHELLIAKFRFKLKKVGKTTRPFRYDLNQTPFYLLLLLVRSWGLVDLGWQDSFMDSVVYLAGR